MKKPLTKLLEKQDDDFGIEVELKEGGYVCPYEDCGREFEAPLRVTNKSVNPPQTYYGCPYCLSKVDVEEIPKVGKVEEVEEKVESTAKLAEIKNIIEKVAEKKKGKSEKEERGEKCPHHFGYLKEKSKNTPIPEECLTCPKMLECML